MLCLIGLWATLFGISTGNFIFVCFNNEFTPALGSALSEGSTAFDTHCKARYAVLFQIWTLPSKPEDEAHIGPTATYDEVIYPGFQHDITALQIQG